MELAPRSRARGVRARELLPHSAAPPGAYAEEWRSYVQALVSDDTDDFQRRLPNFTVQDPGKKYV